MNKLELTKEAEMTHTALRVIDKLLAIPLGEQLYAQRIGMIFDYIELLGNPMFVVNGSPQNKIRNNGGRNQYPVIS